MSAPVRGSTTSATQIVLSWSALSTSASTGGSAITSYNLQWDSGTSGVTWTNLVGYSPSSTSTTYTLTSGITHGSSYEFRVRAKNAFGWGSFSSATTIMSAAVPS
jgi:hypothetical protein